MLGGSSQLVNRNFQETSHKVRPFGRGPISRSLGDLLGSPWLTTYRNDPFAGDPEVFLTAWCTAGSGQKTSLGEPSNRWAREAVADGGDGLKNWGFPRNHAEICLILRRWLKTQNLHDLFRDT